LLAANEQGLLLSAAHATLSGSRGTLAQQLARFAESGVPQLRFVPSGNSPEQPSSPLPFLELSYFNGIGGFSPDGAEYAIYLKPGDCTPAPWANVIANPGFGTVVSESGLGFSWRGNSQSNRLTPWHNDPTTDPQSEIIYIRDDDSGAIWTPTPLPIREDDAYRARHGQGYTVYEHNSHAICQQLTVFVPVDDAGGEPVKIAWLRLRNESGRRRRLTVTFYVEWVLGAARDENQRHIRTSFDTSSKSIFAVNPWRPTYSTEIAFAAIRPDPLSWSADRTPFLGRNGSYRKPSGLGRSRLNGRAGAALDPAAILQTTVSLQPQQETDVICLLGEERSADAIRELVDRYGRIAQVQDALTATKRWWDTKLGAVQVHTPIESVNFLMNRWLLYQSLSCRFWARSAVYQSGGAFGFRDQLQDSLAFLYFAPEATRRHLIESASRQFTQGDVQHWWHPETGLGVRTRCSDDLLWLPFSVAQYVAVTNDSSVLSEEVPFLTGAELDAKEHERLFVPAIEGSGSMLEHCMLAIRRSLSMLGPHGLPLMGSGDWNDGMNRVGVEGRGESVWLAWFLISVVDAFSPILEQVLGPAAAREFDPARKAVASAVEEVAWDGEWYARGFFDDGTPVGTRERPEAKIDSLPQSWAVIGGASDPSRAATAMASVERFLVNEAERLILIFTPPFDNSQPHPGYIMGYPPGIRENGGQYTHAAVWTALALSRLKGADRAAGMLQLINPVERCRNPEMVAKYAGEPYIIPADVYSAPGHVGRAGWTWYTGSSSWFYRTWLEEILGLKLRGSSLSVEPRIPAAWPGFSVRLSYRTAIYQITVERQSSRQPETLIDGTQIPGGAISLKDDGQTHQVLVGI
jgi:cyclic beta-1,2-glucan glucanotransferase